MLALLFYCPSRVVGYKRPVIVLKTMPLQVTQAAIAEVLRLSQQHKGEIKDHPSAESAVVSAQLNFVPGGCAEHRYQLGFNDASPESQTAGSQTIRYGDVALSVSQAAWPHVQQLTLDYVEDLMGGSFRFDNPHLSKTCNCGQSFYLPVESNLS